MRMFLSFLMRIIMDSVKISRVLCYLSAYYHLQDEALYELQEVRISSLYCRTRVADLTGLQPEDIPVSLTEAIAFLQALKK